MPSTLCWISCFYFLYQSILKCAVLAGLISLCAASTGSFVALVLNVLTFFVTSSFWKPGPVLKCSPTEGCALSSALHQGHNYLYKCVQFLPWDFVGCTNRPIDPGPLRCSLWLQVLRNTLLHPTWQEMEHCLCSHTHPGRPWLFWGAGSLAIADWSLVPCRHGLYFKAQGSRYLWGTYWVQLFLLH